VGDRRRVHARHGRVRARPLGAYRADPHRPAAARREDSCTSRHLLALAIEKQGSVIHAAEARAIAQTVELQKQIDDGKATDPYPPGTLDRALRNARRLVDDLDHARRLVKAADCTSVPKIPKP
jgi:hypothetical protein